MLTPVWYQQAPVTDPSSNYPGIREYTAFAYGPGFGNVLFGGYNTPLIADDTWVWDGTTWTLQSPVTSPSPRFNAALCRFDVGGVMLLFGGITNPVYPAPRPNDTWAWDGGDWSLVSPSGSGPVPFPTYVGSGPSETITGFFANGMVYDPVHEQAVLVGYYSTALASGGPATLTFQTWLWDGAGWSMSGAGGPAPATWAFAWDEANMNAVLYGGDTANQTWTWDGGSWTLRGPGASPPARSFPYGPGENGLAYHKGLGYVVLFGGVTTDASSVFDDTWSWDGTTWSELTFAFQPSARATTLSGDDTNEVVWLYGGYNAALGGVPTLKDTWGLFGEGPPVPSVGALFLSDGTVWHNVLVDGVLYNAEDGSGWQDVTTEGALYLSNGSEQIQVA